MALQDQLKKIVIANKDCEGLYYKDIDSTPEFLIGHPLLSFNF